MKAGHGNEKTIKAVEVSEGQTVTRIVCYYSRPWRRRPVVQDQRVRRTRGRWPTVLEADFWQNGEGGEPTIYLTLDDSPGMSFCLAPDDDVTVLEAPA